MASAPFTRGSVTARDLGCDDQARQTPARFVVSSRLIEPIDRPDLTAQPCEPFAAALPMPAIAQGGQTDIVHHGLADLRCCSIPCHRLRRPARGELLDSQPQNIRKCTQIGVAVDRPLPPLHLAEPAFRTTNQPGEDELGHTPATALSCDAPTDLLTVFPFTTPATVRPRARREVP